MQKKVSLRLLPSESADEQRVSERIAQATGKRTTDISGYKILKRSIDARSTTIWINLTVQAYINEPFREWEPALFSFKDVTSAVKKVVVIGGGPAGIFAALQLIENGIKPVILERGKDVRARRRDLAVLNKEGVINPESNYCFGEGGAGTYSDGKLYTRSSKRGDVDRILKLFVHFGADENILYNAHPHIGTNKLPAIITGMRKRILECGGEFYFDKKVTDFFITDNKLSSVKTSDGDEYGAAGFILATGHSARDIFMLLQAKNLEISAKPFALGVRVEHPQELINTIQYGSADFEQQFLPPASYSLVQQVSDRGVFSFCMCPGGIIAPASTNESELVVNGWSPSRRNNPFANSGMVVQVEVQDVMNFFTAAGIKKDPASPFLMMDFQKFVEAKAYESGGGKFVAPAQRMVDFTQEKISATLPACSYLPGINTSMLSEVLPPFIYTRLQKAFKDFAKKMPSTRNRHGYFTNEAVVVATESRTSSPVKIPRDPLLLHHPQLVNLFPCGEGGGYAGGIVSAAMDGQRIAVACSEII